MNVVVWLGHTKNQMQGGSMQPQQSGVHGLHNKENLAILHIRGTNNSYQEHFMVGLKSA